MKVHKYTISNYVSVFDISFENVGPRIRLFIPDIGVLGYVGKKIEFFSNSPEIMTEAQKIISGECNSGEEYLGDVDGIPKSLLECLADSGRDYNRISNQFHSSARNVVDLVESIKNSQLHLSKTFKT